MQPVQITYLRSVLGIGKAEFSRRMGVDPVAVYYWETAQRNPSKTAVLLMHLIASTHHIEIPDPGDILEVDDE